MASLLLCKTKKKLVNDDNILFYYFNLQTMASLLICKSKKKLVNDDNLLFYHFNLQTMASILLYKNKKIPSLMMSMYYFEDEVPLIRKRCKPLA